MATRRPGDSCSRASTLLAVIVAGAWLGGCGSATPYDSGEEACLGDCFYRRTTVLSSIAGCDVDEGYGYCAAMP